jgi:hypothetical protein
MGLNLGPNLVLVKHLTKFDLDDVSQDHAGKEKFVLRPHLQPLLAACWAPTA